jgi:hypothetical protein
MQGVRGSNPLSSTSVISQEIGITLNPQCGLGVMLFWRVVGGWAGSRGWVDDQLAQQLAGGRVDDADLEVLDQQQDGGSGVGSADADVVEAAVDPQGDLAVGVDAVAPDAVVGVVVAACGRGGFGRAW